MRKTITTGLIIGLMAMVTSPVTQAKSENNTTKRIVAVNRYLANTPMNGIAPILEKEGKIHNVSPYFIAAVASKESSKGYKACPRNKKNVWGLGQCGRVWKVPYFETWTQAVNFFVRFIRGKTNVTSGWPNAKTPYQFAGYCSGCEHEWARGVTFHMNQMGSNGNITYR